MKATVNIITWNPDQFDFRYIDEEGEACLLNWDLAQRKNLTWTRMQVIMQLHTERVALFKKIGRAFIPRWTMLPFHPWLSPVNPSQETLVRLASEVEELEYQLQEAWGFDRDRSYHTWWHKIPECKCGATAQLSREDRINSICPHRIINAQCLIHGAPEWLVIEKLSTD